MSPAACDLPLPPPGVLAELDAFLQTASTGMQGLVSLLGERPGCRAVQADGLRVLLLYLADQLEQAADVTEQLLARQRGAGGPGEG